MKDPNVYLISADEQIDTYAFAQENIDVGLIYSGILELELTYLGIPVISAAYSRYHETGFVFEPETRSEYRTMLIEGEAVKERFQTEKEIRLDKLYTFAHWYFFKAGYEMPILSPNRLGHISYSDLTHKDINPSSNAGLRRTINKLLCYVSSWDS
jgi:hypothetical protein